MAASHFQPAPAGQEALAARWEAGGAVGSAWAGSICRRRRPRHQAGEAQTRAPFGASGMGRAGGGLRFDFFWGGGKAHGLPGPEKAANKASALASGKCSCLWLRACSLARIREVRCWCYPACSGAGARCGARTLGSIRARDAWHRLVRSERDPRRSEAQTRTRAVRAAAVLPSELSYEGCQPRSFPAGCFRNPQRSSLRSTKRAPRRRQSRTRECGQSKGRRQRIQSLPRRKYRKVCAISI